MEKEIEKKMRGKTRIFSRRVSPRFAASQGN
jgi:hypothetical protein